MLMPYIWDLSEKTVNQIEKSEIGDIVHTGEQMVPAVFQEEDNTYLFVFTSEKSIPNEYIKRFAIVKVTIQRIWFELLGVESVLGKPPLLMINPFDDKSEIFTKKQLKEMI